MRTNTKYISLLILIFITGFTLFSIPVALADSDEPIFFEEMVMMRDGKYLYTRVYLPGPGSYPVILSRTPYGIGDPGVGPDPEDPTTWPQEIYNGYARVLQDTRGRYSSEGIDRLFYDDGPDGYDAIEWIASQPWCDGNIGMYGGSANGITTYLAAGENHPNLKAAISYVASADLYNDVTFEGGAFRADSMIWTYGQTLNGLSLSHLLSVAPPSEWATHLTNIGMKLYDLYSHTSVIPGYTAVDSATWMNLPLKGGDPSYNIMQPFGDEILSHPTQDAFRDKLNVHDTIDIPILHVAGWFDFFSRSTIDAFVDLQHLGNQKLFVLPGTHGGLGEMPYEPYYEWFDYWLKDEDTGIMNEPSVWYYGLGDDEWRYADQWPIGDLDYTTFYMHDDGSLDTNPSSEFEESLSYLYDPMNPVLTWGGRNLGLPAGSKDQTPVVMGRDDILSYITQPLVKDLEIAGPIKVYLSASSDCFDTDFTAKLIDVYPTGELMLIADGIIRARYRNSMEYPELMSGNSEDVYEFAIEMGDICQVFKEGHSIRIDISSSNFPRYDRNLNTGGELYNEEEDVIQIAENTIHHNSDHPSYLVLPIISDEPRVIEGCARIKIKGMKYKGTAELHIYEEAIYLYFDDEWIKYDIHYYKKHKKLELYLCIGDYGHLMVLKHKLKCRTYIQAVGRKVFFIAML